MARLQRPSRQERMALLKQSRVAQAGTECHGGGIILSKKPPEWQLPLPLPVVSHGRYLPAASRGQPRALSPRRSTWSASGSDLIENNDKSPVGRLSFYRMRATRVVWRGTPLHLIKATRPFDRTVFARLSSLPETIKAQSHD